MITGRSVRVHLVAGAKGAYFFFLVAFFFVAFFFGAAFFLVAFFLVAAQEAGKGLTDSSRRKKDGSAQGCVQRGGGGAGAHPSSSGRPSSWWPSSWWLRAGRGRRSAPGWWSARGGADGPRGASYWWRVKGAPFFLAGFLAAGFFLAIFFLAGAFLAGFLAGAFLAAMVMWCSVLLAGTPMIRCSKDAGGAVRRAVGRWGWCSGCRYSGRGRSGG